MNLIIKTSLDMKLIKNPINEDSNFIKYSRNKPFLEITVK